MAERWMTFEELCMELHLPAQPVLRLIHEGRIVGIGTGRNKRSASWRYLDPAEKYKRALNAQYSVLRRNHPDLMEAPLLSTADVAAIFGITPGSVRFHICRKGLKPIKIRRRSYFSVEELRQYLLRRERKEPRDRRARCELLVRWAITRLQSYPDATLTAEEIYRDNDLEAKLRKLMRLEEPERGRALAEFWRRFELAGAVARSIAKSQSK